MNTSAPWRKTGRLFMAVAIGHTLCGFLVWALEWWSLLAPWPSDQEAGSAALAWFWVCGLLLGVWGYSLERSQTAPLPRVIGWIAVGVGLGGWALWPISGFPLVVALGGFILAVAEPADPKS